ncbi:MAG: 5'-methylthioadenosine/S-adenosylhomocysteine nucleosidase [Anaerolineae bacterium]
MNASNQGPTALVGIRSELGYLREHVAVDGETLHPWGRLALGRWQPGGVAVALVTTAIGKVSAAMAVQGAIDACRPRLLINCGSAGALAPDLAVGAVVLAEWVLAHDQGVYFDPDTASAAGPDGFIHAGSPLPEGRRRSFPADPALLARVTQAARQAGITLRVGPIASGDQVIFQGQRKRWLHETFGALAVENEGAAVAQVAHCHDLPWLVLRGVSDTADGEAAYDFTQLVLYDEDLEQSPRLAQAALALRQGARSPALLLRAARFRQGQRQAMTAIAALLDTCLPVL